MLGSTQFDSYFIFFFNWLVAIAVLSLMGWIATMLSSKATIEARHYINLVLLVSFLVIPVALSIVARSGAGYVSWANPITRKLETDRVEPLLDTSIATAKTISVQKEVLNESMQLANELLVVSAPAVRADSAMVSAKPPFTMSWLPIARAAMLIVGLVWLIGSLVCICRLIRKMQSLGCFLSRLQLVSEENLTFLMQEAKQKFGLRQSVQLLHSSFISVPISLRLMRSIIVVPECFASLLSPEQQRAVLLHEMAHLHRGDSYVGLIQEACQLCYWWHSWLLGRSNELNRLRELLCDQKVVEIEGDGRTLAEALFRVAQSAVEPSLRISCVTSMVEEVHHLAVRMKVLCEGTKLNLNPLSVASRTLLLMGAMAVLVVTSIPVLRGQPIVVTGEAEVDGNERTDAQTKEGKSDEEWTKILVAAHSHLPVAFHNGPQIAALDRSRSLTIVEQAWPQIQIADVKTGILKAFQFSKNPNVLAVLNLGMTDEDPFVQNYARSYLCDWALQKFEPKEAEYSAWYQLHRELLVNEVLQLSYRRIERMCKDVPAREAILRLQDLDESIGIGWRTDTSNVRRSVLRQSGLGELPIQWILSTQLEPKQKAYALELLRQLPVPSHGSVGTLRSWLGVEYPLMVRASAAIALVESDRDAAINAMLALIEQVTRDKNNVEWAEDTLLRELCSELCKTGEPRIIPEMIAIMDCDNSNETINCIDAALTMYRLGEEWVREELRPMRDGPWWRRWWDKNRHRMPESLRQVAIRDIPKTKFGQTYVPFPADLDTHEGRTAFLEQELKMDNPRCFALAMLFSSSRDPRGIPILIGAIDSDNSYETVYGFGYFGLGFFKGCELTDVEYSPFHDGAWWRRWWDVNKHRFPLEAQAIPIPEFQKSMNGKSYQPFPANMDTFEGRVDYLRRELAVAGSQFELAAEALESCPDPKAIATLIGVLISCEETQADSSAFFRPLSKRLAKLRAFEMQSIMDGTHDAAWWRAWYSENRFKIQGLDDFDLPDFRDELRRRTYE